jgi:Cu+-exporting ATPase
VRALSADRRRGVKAVKQRAAERLAAIGQRIVEASGHGMAIDPVCWIKVDLHAAKHLVEHDGETRYLRGACCREKFLADPDAVLQGDVAAAPAPAGTIYTCPMYPEVSQLGAGACPKCGMALEPMLPSADADDGGELAVMTRRFWNLVALTMPVFALAMGPQLFGWRWPLPWERVAGRVEAVLASVAVLWGGAPFCASGWRCRC